MPIIELLKLVGLRLDQIGEPNIFSGLHIIERNNNFIVSRVQHNSPACKAGLVLDDELIAINNFRIRELEDIQRDRQMAPQAALAQYYNTIAPIAYGLPTRQTRTAKI